MSRRVSCIGILLFAWFFVGCATLTEDQCQQADWENIGKVDARRGRPEAYKSYHVQACEGTSAVDEASYGRGWQKGRADYCEAENGYFVGVRGESVVGSCSVEFDEQFKKGRRVFLLVKERNQVSEQIKTERDRIANDESVVNHVAQVYHLLTLTSPTASLEAREHELNNEIRDLRTSAPTQSLAMSTHNGLSEGQSLIGAFIGTGAGFGIGHAIQGRYSSSGWMWTVGEIGTLAAIAVASSNACPNDRSTGNFSGHLSESRSCSDPWVGITMLGWLGFRVWQSVDLWRYAFRANQGYDVAMREEAPWSLALAPNGVTWSYSFE